MKRPIRLFTLGLLLAIVTATMFSCPPPGIPADHFQVRFTGDLADARKFAIGKTTDAFVIDPGYFPNNTTTDFYHAPADTYNIYDFRDGDADWWETGSDYIFEAQTKYEIQGMGLNAWNIIELP